MKINRGLPKGFARPNLLRGECSFKTVRSLKHQSRKKRMNLINTWDVRTFRVVRKIFQIIFTPHASIDVMTMLHMLNTWFIKVLLIYKILFQMSTRFLLYISRSSLDYYVELHNESGFNDRRYPQRQISSPCKIMNVVWIFYT